jgi:hypothetical protein
MNLGVENEIETLEILYILAYVAHMTWDVKQVHGHM